MYMLLPTVKLTRFFISLIWKVDIIAASACGSLNKVILRKTIYLNLKPVVLYTLIFVSKHGLKTHHNRLYQIHYVSIKISIRACSLEQKCSTNFKALSRCVLRLMVIHMQWTLWTVMKFVLYIAHIYM